MFVVLTFGLGGLESCFKPWYFYRKFYFTVNYVWFVHLGDLGDDDCHLSTEESDIESKDKQGLNKLHWCKNKPICL